MMKRANMAEEGSPEPMRGGIVRAQGAWEAVRAGTDQAAELGARTGSAARTRNCQVRAISGGATSVSLNALAGGSSGSSGRGVAKERTSALNKGAERAICVVESLIQPFSTSSQESSESGFVDAE